MTRGTRRPTAYTGADLYAAADPTGDALLVEVPANGRNQRRLTDALGHPRTVDRDRGTWVYIIDVHGGLLVGAGARNDNGYDPRVVVAPYEALFIYTGAANMPSRFMMLEDAPGDRVYCFNRMIARFSDRTINIGYGRQHVPDLPMLTKPTSCGVCAEPIGLLQISVPDDRLSHRMRPTSGWLPTHFDPHFVENPVLCSTRAEPRKSETVGLCKHCNEEIAEVPKEAGTKRTLADPTGTNIWFHKRTRSPHCLGVSVW